MKANELNVKAPSVPGVDELRERAESQGNKAKNTEMPALERNFESYRKIFGFNEEELIGKKILNIGSGYTGMFEQEAKRKHLDVVSINPNLRDGLEEGRSVGEKPVAAYVQNLPFPDKTFDYELSLLVVPEHLRQKDDTLAYEEIYRTLKPGGIFISGPHFMPMLQTRDNFSDAIKILQKNGCDVRIEPISNPEYVKSAGGIWFTLKIVKPKE